MRQLHIFPARFGIGIATGKDASGIAEKEDQLTYDEGLAQRVREYLDGDVNVYERRMFGGIVFMVNGNMAVGIAGSDLMVRVGPKYYGHALKQAHVREMDFTGKPMKGFVFVSWQAIESDDRLQYWVDQGYRFAGSLEPK